MPKRRIPYLFINNTSQALNEAELDARINNLERAPVEVTVRAKTIDVRRPRKPRPAFIPSTSPNSGGVVGTQIFLALTKIEGSGGGTNFYTLNANDELEFIAEFSFEGLNGGDWVFGATAKKLGSSHYILAYRPSTDSGALWRSDDGCVTWTPVRSDIDAFNDNVALEMDANGRLWLALLSEEPEVFDYTIQYSDDLGETWTIAQTITDFDTWSLLAHPTNPDIMVGLGYNYLGNSVDGFLNFIYTDDGWATYTNFSLPAEPQFSGFELKQLVWAPSGRLIIICASILEGSPYPLLVFYADDFTGGPSAFTKVVVQASAADGTDWFNPVISLHAEGSKIFAFAAETHEFGSEGTSAHIYQSDDEGETWNEIPSFPTVGGDVWEDINSGFYDAERDRLIIITTGEFPSENNPAKVWLSSPPGENWIDITPEGEYGVPGAIFMAIWRG